MLACEACTAFWFLRWSPCGVVIASSDHVMCHTVSVKQDRGPYNTCSLVTYRPRRSSVPFEAQLTTYDDQP